MQQETIAAYHADEAEQIHSVWKRLVAQYGLRNEEVECTLMREQNLVNSLNQKATDELLIVTGLRRGFTSPSSRRQASSIFHIDIAIAS